MKKTNTKGFTLIELLAVITIMGILMIVAIPTVSRTIENSRKDTFIDMAKSYVTGASNMWAADNLQCTAADGKAYLSSAVPNGSYRILVDTSNPSNYPVLLEKGGKSSWGNRDIKGYILVYVKEQNIAQDGQPANYTRNVEFYPILTDGVHGVNVLVDDDEITEPSDSDLIEGSDLVRGNIIMSGASYWDVESIDRYLCVEV